MLRVDFDHVRREHEVDAMVRALAHPTRRAIVEALAERDTDAGELTVLAFSVFGLMPPTTSGHLRTLREAGVVTSSAAESHRVYSLVPGAVAMFAAWAEEIASATPGRWVPYDIEG